MSGKKSAAVSDTRKQQHLTVIAFQDIQPAVRVGIIGKAIGVCSK
jgi:hypothetical protein